MRKGWSMGLLERFRESMKQREEEKYEQKIENSRKLNLPEMVFSGFGKRKKLLRYNE